MKTKTETKVSESKALENGRSLIGIVKSAKMQKTVIVSVTETHRHPLYHKTMKHTERYAAHVEGLTVAVGDRVKITEMKPMSKTKFFTVVEILK